MGLFRRLKASPALIVASIALFVALTGTAVATTTQRSREFDQNAQAQSQEQLDQGADVKNKSLTPKDFKGSVRGAPTPRVRRERQDRQVQQARQGRRGRSVPAMRSAGSGTDPSRSVRHEAVDRAPQISRSPGITSSSRKLGSTTMRVSVTRRSSATSCCRVAIPTGAGSGCKTGVGPEKQGTMALNAVGVIAAGGGCRSQLPELRRGQTRRALHQDHSD